MPRDDLIGSGDFDNFDESREDAHDKDFSSYRRLILYELQRQNREIVKNDAAIQELKSSVTVLKVRAALWGALAGLVGSVLAATLAGLLVHLMTG